LRPAARGVLTAGGGRVAECVGAETGKDVLTARVLRRFHAEPPRPRLIVVQALAKGDRGELAVEMMTEAGVDVIVPWAASRCVVQGEGGRAGKARARGRRKIGRGAGREGAGMGGEQAGVTM